MFLISMMRMVISLKAVRHCTAATGIRLWSNLLMVIMNGQNLLAPDYFNLGLITETPIAFYLLQCKRAKAVEVLVRHFDVEFYYFLRRARGKKVTLFFRDVASKRSWFLRSYSQDGCYSEDLLNSHINRICSYVNFNCDLEYETN